MRISLAIVLVVAITVAVVVASHGDDDPGATSTGTVSLVGDSLNVGIEPYLDEALPGWRIDAHDRVGKTTAEGVEELRALRGKLAPVVIVSLGTNDAEGSEQEFARLVGEAIDLVGPNRCLVWATIVRDGAERTGFDHVLREASDEHPNVHLVEWATLVEDDGTLLTADQVHGTPEGYARRAQETARVVRDC